VSAIFPKLEGLDSLARRDGVDIRPTLVRVLTDLYVQKAAHSAEEERHYTELVLRLIDSVDLATRVAVARKIAGYAGAPPAVARRLARDSIEVAEPILRQCGALGSADLAAIVRDFGPTHAAIIAARETAKPQQRSVAEPTKAPRVERSARENTEIGIADLFFSADSAARRTLLLSLGNADSEALQSVRPLETIRALETAALARDPVAFTTLIESALSLTRSQAERFVHDPSGEPLLVAAKALAMPAVVLQRVLMFIDPAIGESVARVFDLAAFYERMSADAAHKIIDSVRGREPVRARKPQHRPMYYDDESGRSRRAGATRRVGTPAETQAPIRVEPGKTHRTM
jgi:uncharacterized protein (DUF2336 family)